MKKCDIFLIFAQNIEALATSQHDWKIVYRDVKNQPTNQNIDCGHTLELHNWGGSNTSTHDLCFRAKLGK